MWSATLVPGYGAEWFTSVQNVFTEDIQYQTKLPNEQLR